MRIWLTTDTHFGHSKMVEYCGRPENFSDRILENFKVIKEHDILLHLGDFCIGNELMWHLQFKAATRGIRRWLVRGNHDRKSNSWYLERGWDWVGESMELKMFNHNILFTHRPNPDPLYITKHGLLNINIHGHLHNSGHRDDEVPLVPFYHKLLALEGTNYQPVLLEKFIANSRKAQLIKEPNKFMSEETTTETTTEETTSTETSTEAPKEETSAE